MLPSCPSGTFLHLDIQPSPIHGSTKFRTKRFYTFRLEFAIDLSIIRRDYGLSEAAFFYSKKARQGKTGLEHPQLAINLQFCPVNGNLCSPFVFESARMEEAAGQLLGQIHTPDHDHAIHEDESFDSNDGQDGILLSYLDQQEGDDNDQRQLSLTPQKERPSLHYRERVRKMTTHGETNLFVEPPAPTIDQAFKRIKEAIQIKDGQLDSSYEVKQIFVSYNKTFGFPHRVVIHYEKGDSTPTSDISTPSVPAIVLSFNESVYFADFSDLQFEASGISAATSPLSVSSNSPNIQLEQARTMWTLLNAQNYTFLYNQYFDGLGSNDNINRRDTPYPWSVTVQNGLVHEVLDANKERLQWIREDPAANHTKLPGDNDSDVQREEQGENNASNQGGIDVSELEDGEALGGDNEVDMSPNGIEESTGPESSHTEDDDHNDGEHDPDESDDEDSVSRPASSSPKFYVEMNQAAALSLVRIHYDIDIQVQEPREYLPMASVQFFLTNDTIHNHIPVSDELAALKFDMAALLSERSVTFYEPVVIHVVSDGKQPSTNSCSGSPGSHIFIHFAVGIAMASYMLIGVFAFIQLLFLVSTVKHRNENVMRLSQTSFLILLQVASLVAMIGSAFFRPSSDVFCYLSGASV